MIRWVVELESGVWLARPARSGPAGRWDPVSDIQAAKVYASRVGADKAATARSVLRKFPNARAVKVRVTVEEVA